MQRVRSLLHGLVARLGRAHKRLILLLIDGLAAPVALALAGLLATGAGPAVPHLLLAAAVAMPASAALGMHRIQLKAGEAASVWRTALVALALAALAAIPGPALPAPGIVLFGLFFFLLALGARRALLHLLVWVLTLDRPQRRVLIWGAGDTGVQLAMALRAHRGISPMGFIDDAAAMQGLTVAGLRVHGPDGVPRLARRRGVDRVILAMPSAGAARLAEIAAGLRAAGLEVMSVPSLAQLVGEEALVDPLAPLVPGRFLNRRHVEADLAPAAAAYAGRSILVTGAGGSVGGELCRQLLAFRPRRLVLFEISEAALYTIDREIRERAPPGTEVAAVLGSVADPRLARAAMLDHGVEVVLHAAAYKHVPLVEANPVAGVANNVLGTRILAEAAGEAGVRRFVLVSSDKAVRPANVMGASKRTAELVVQDLARRSRCCRFSTVRFGNVLGSSGSVVPLFRDQIARGGPVTLTHEDVTRYFMTVSEAVRLVLLAGSWSGPARVGGVYVLDMGRPVRIRDLAAQMIEAAGHRVRDAAHPEGIEIRVIGLRPGEKLHEELLAGTGLLPTPHPKILRAEENCPSELEVAAMLRALRAAVAAGDARAVRAVLCDCLDRPGGGGPLPMAAAAGP